MGIGGAGIARYTSSTAEERSPITGTFIDTLVKNLIIGSCRASQLGGIPGAIGAALKCVKRIG